MRRVLAVLVCFLALSAATVHAEAPPPSIHPNPSDDPRPSTGWLGIGLGIGGFAWTVAQVGTIPVCYAAWYPTEPEICLGTTTVLAAGGLAVGITGVVIGKRKRAAYKAWRERELRRRGVALDDFSAGYHAGQGMLQVRFAF